MRRLRRHNWTRRLVAENAVTAADFIWPLFLIEGKQKREPIASMPGVERLSIDLAIAAAEEARAWHPAVALFPHTEVSLKTPDGREAASENLVCRGRGAIRDGPRSRPDVRCGVDPYTSTAMTACWSAITSATTRR